LSGVAAAPSDREKLIPSGADLNLAKTENPVVAQARSMIWFVAMSAMKMPAMAEMGAKPNVRSCTL
jgi:hypothetical protein